MPILRVETRGAAAGPVRLRRAAGYCFRLPRVTLSPHRENPYAHTRTPPLRSAFAFPYIKRERFGKATSDLPTTASREHPKYALERPCRSVLRLAPRCAYGTTSKQTDAQPCAVVGRFALVALSSALVALPSALVALPSALAAIGQRRAVLPVET